MSKIDATALLKQFNQPRSNKSVKTISNNRIIVVPKTSITHNAATGEYDFGGAGVVKGKDAADIMIKIDDLYVSDHLNITTNANWQKLYQKNQRPVPFMNSAGNTTSQRLDTYPCHYCGIIVPQQLIQIDHHKPQSYPAVGLLKVFHSIGVPGVNLTSGSAKGVKNQQVGNILSGGSLNPVPVKGRAFGQAWAQKGPDPNRDLRYSLTDEGKTVLTLAVMFWGKTGTESRGKNSLLNLVPSCPSCNRTKSNIVHAT